MGDVVGPSERLYEGEASCFSTSFSTSARIDALGAAADHRREDVDGHDGHPVSPKEVSGVVTSCADARSCLR
jgi:hypothetical protein